MLRVALLTLTLLASGCVTTASEVSGGRVIVNGIEQRSDCAATDVELVGWAGPSPAEVGIDVSESFEVKPDTLGLAIHWEAPSHAGGYSFSLLDAAGAALRDEHSDGVGIAGISASINSGNSRYESGSGPVPAGTYRYSIRADGLVSGGSLHVVATECR